MVVQGRVDDGLNMSKLKSGHDITGHGGVGPALVTTTTNIVTASSKVPRYSSFLLPRLLVTSSFKSIHSLFNMVQTQLLVILAGLAAAKGSIAPALHMVKDGGEQQVLTTTPPVSFDEDVHQVKKECVCRLVQCRSPVTVCSLTDHTGSRRPKSFPQVCRP